MHVKLTQRKRLKKSFIMAVIDNASMFCCGVFVLFIFLGLHSAVKWGAAMIGLMLLSMSLEKWAKKPYKKRTYVLEAHDESGEFTPEMRDFTSDSVNVRNNRLQ